MNKEASESTVKMRRKVMMGQIKELIRDLGMSSNSKRFVEKSENKLFKMMQARRGIQDDAEERPSYYELRELIIGKMESY